MGWAHNPINLVIALGIVAGGQIESDKGREREKESSCVILSVGWSELCSGAAAIATRLIN